MRLRTAVMEPAINRLEFVSGMMAPTSERSHDSEDAKHPYPKQTAGFHPSASCHSSIRAAAPEWFEAGKSSFLNHFIGRDILPVGAVPVTARLEQSPKSLHVETCE